MQEIFCIIYKYRSLSGKYLTLGAGPIPKEKMKNTPIILLMSVGKTQRNKLIYFTNILNNFQILSGSGKLFKLFGIMFTYVTDTL
jgi:hypothetical protein